MKIQVGMKKAKKTPKPAAPIAPATAPPIEAAFSTGVRGGAIGTGGTPEKSSEDKVEDEEEESKSDDHGEADEGGCGDVDDDVDSVVELAYVPVLTVEASVVEAGV